jgi:hypothetical protein
MTSRIFLSVVAKEANGCNINAAPAAVVYLTKERRSMASRFIWLKVEHYYF